jgi:hypothetical protein
MGLHEKVLDVREEKEDYEGRRRVVVVVAVAVG